MADSFLAPYLKGFECAAKGGRSVVATRRLPAEALLVVWGGSILTHTQLSALPPQERRISIQVDEDAFLYGADQGPADWVNHSCDPNAGLRGHDAVGAEGRP